MRKVLEVMGLVGLGILFWSANHALNGPNPLPDRIPTHFALDGQPTDWGFSRSLWMLPYVAVGVYLLISLVGEFSGFFRYPVQVTDENRDRLHSLTRQMIACLKVEAIWLFVWIQSALLDAVRIGVWSKPLALGPLPLGPLFLIVVLATVGGHVIASIFVARPVNSDLVP
jgi:hypothetical protein